MKLNNIYLIKRTAKSRTRWDENSAFVIAAKDARQCRKMAAEYPHGDENREVWRRPALSSVTKVGVTARKTPYIILRDFNAG